MALLAREAGARRRQLSHFLSAKEITYMIKLKILSIALAGALTLTVVPHANAWYATAKVIDLKTGVASKYIYHYGPDPAAIALNMFGLARGAIAAVQQPYYNGYLTYTYGACAPGTYQAASGNCVGSPDQNSSGATARCADGTWSHSEHPYASGTCSHHGGVLEFENDLHNPHVVVQPVPVPVPYAVPVTPPQPQPRRNIPGVNCFNLDLC
jgi:hypothetical protein